ncbi:MAG: IS1634 family transposase [Acidobacteriota bacterium]|nr:IS1634 family transposase [Acidobacteriota bacterium]
MFLRSIKRKKSGKEHRYFSVVENRRLADGRTMQRQVVYLGEINDSQQAAWRKSLEVFDEDRRAYRPLSLFPDDRLLPPDAVDAVSVQLSQMQLRRPRAFGDCWLGCLLWEELGLGRFWARRLADDEGDVPWEKVLAILAINRLIDPGSEFRVHRQWFGNSAMDELLGVDEAAAGKDRLYRCLDLLLAHKDELCRLLAERWKTLFDASFDVLLYDLTSTYFEGECGQIPKAKHGYSRDRRGDCRQVVVALVVTIDGLPLGYEVLPGNTSDKTTLKAFLEKVERLHGKARRVWVMDRGIPTEATLKQMRDQGMAYLVGTPRALLPKLEQKLLELPWQQVHEGMAVKLLKHEGEMYVLAHSDQRDKKERAMRRRRFKALARGLHALRKRLPKRDTLLKRVAVLQSKAGAVARMIRVHLPPQGKAITPKSFHYELNIEAYRDAGVRHGSYLLRTNLNDPQAAPAGLETISGNAPQLWTMYMQLVGVEAAFRSLKSELGIRPIYHRIEPRVEAHILVAFLGYSLTALLRKKLSSHAPGLTPAAVLEALSEIRMVDVCIPTTDGRWLIMPRHTEPEPRHEMLLQRLGLTLPPQPAPRIRSGQLIGTPA